MDDKVDQASGGWLSPFLQKLRLAAALPHVRGDVLDYGCGNGALFGCLSATQRAGYVGYDIDPDVIRLARQRWSDGIFIDDLALIRDRQFDTVVSLAVIEHVPVIRSYLDTLRKLLRPGGTMVLTSPHPSFDSIHRIGAWMGLFNQEASKEHNELVTAVSMNRYCGDLGLELAITRRFVLGVNQLFVLRRPAHPALA